MRKVLRRWGALWFLLSPVQTTPGVATRTAARFPPAAAPEPHRTGGEPIHHLRQHTDFLSVVVIGFDLRGAAIQLVVLGEWMWILCVRGCRLL